jgi:TM2 domain-containing membrane protein YozV
MTLQTQDFMLIEQRIANEAKSTGVAYLLWVFTGGLGGHRFYLGRAGSGLLMLFLFIVGWATIMVGVGAFLLIAVALWVLIDAFLIPGMIQRDRNRLRSELTSQALNIVGREPQRG